MKAVQPKGTNAKTPVAGPFFGKTGKETFFQPGSLYPTQIQKGGGGESTVQRVAGGCPGKPIDLTLIPDVMDANGWHNGATLLRQWFNNPPGGGPPDTTTVTMDWILSFGRAKAIYDTIFSNKLYANEAAKREIIRLLGRLGVKKGDSFNFKLPTQQLDPVYYVNHRVVDATEGGVLDDLSATLGKFDLRIVVAGNISLKGLVTIDTVGVYTPDNFDFIGHQYLGCWNTCNNKVSTNYFRCDGAGVDNGDFRNWRTAHGKGGDYKIYSDVKTTTLAVPETFVLDPTK